MIAFDFVLVLCLSAFAVTPEEQAVIDIIKARTGFVSMDVVYAVVQEDFVGPMSCFRKCRYAFSGDEILYTLDHDLPPKKELSPDQASTRKMLQLLTGQNGNVDYDHKRQALFFHNGEWTVSSWSYSPQLKTPSVAAYVGNAVRFFGDGVLPSARALIGEVGSEATDQSLRTPATQLAAFLDSPGPFALLEENGFRILSHCAKEKWNGGVLDITVDLWLDKNNNLVRIDQGGRPWGVPDETVRRIAGRPWHEVKSMRVQMEFSEFVNCGGETRFPTFAVKTEWDADPSAAEALEQEFARTNPSEDERRLERIK